MNLNGHIRRTVRCWILFVVLGSILVRVSQVLYLRSIAAKVSVETARILPEQGYLDPSKYDLINYGQISLFNSIVRGVIERVDDQSFIHLIMLAIATYMITKATWGLQTKRDKANLTVWEFVLRTAKSPLYVLAVVSSLILYFIAINDRPGDIRGNFFVTSEHLLIRWLQYIEGTLHLLTIPIAYLAIPIAWSAVDRLQVTLLRGESLARLQCINYLLNCWTTAFLFGCAYHIVCHHVLVKIVPYIFPAVTFADFMVGTALYTWPFMLVTLVALSRVASSCKHTIRITNLSEVKDGHFFLFFVDQSRPPR